MRKIVLFLTLFLTTFSFSQNINIPDVNFKNALLEHGVTIMGTGISKIDANNDGEISRDEARFYYGRINVSSKNITNLNGIEEFVSLRILECHSNQLTSLDVSENRLLTQLYCYNNQLSRLNFRQNHSLSQLQCQNNQLTFIDLSQNSLLTELFCENNQLPGLDLFGLTSLVNLRCNNNQLMYLNIIQNLSLAHIHCYNNQLTSLNVSQNPSLVGLYCSNNKLTSLNISQNPSLGAIYCDNNQLLSLNVANGNNNNMLNNSFRAYNNPNLTCIQIDGGFTPPNNWYKDEAANYSTNCVLSTNNFELSKQITVYPNPVNSILNIQNSEGIAVKNYTVLDVNGRVLMKPLQENQNNQINLTGLTSGIYFIQLETDKGVAVKRIIKK